MTGTTRLLLLGLLLGLTSGILTCTLAGAQEPPTSPPTVKPIDGEPPELHEVAVQLNDLHSVGKCEEARAICEERLAAATDPEHRAYFLWYIGRTYAKQWQLDRAIETYQQVLADYPNSKQDWWVKYYLPKAYEAKAVRGEAVQESMAAAIQVLEQLVRDYPNHSDVARLEHVGPVLRAIWG